MMKKEELNSISNQKFCQKTKANNYIYKCTNSGALFIFSERKYERDLKSTY